MQRKFDFSVDEFYHIYNRGNSKSVIFRLEEDKKRFQKLLYVCNGTKPVVFKTIQSLALDEIDRGETLVDIGAYCLMDNHFHLLLREKTPNGISIFVQKLLTAYSKYFNKRYERVGVLFEGPFRAIHVDSDEYLKYLFAYIHLNPVKMVDPKWREVGITDLAKAKKYLTGYGYSSYSDYLGFRRGEESILKREAFPDYFSQTKDFEGFIEDWLTFQSQALE